MTSWSKNKPLNALETVHFWLYNMMYDTDCVHKWLALYTHEDGMPDATKIKPWDYVVERRPAAFLGITCAIHQIFNHVNGCSKYPKPPEDSLAQNFEGAAFGKLSRMINDLCVLLLRGYNPATGVKEASAYEDNHSIPEEIDKEFTKLLNFVDNEAKHTWIINTYKYLRSKAGTTSKADLEYVLMTILAYWLEDHSVDPRCLDVYSIRQCLDLATKYHSCEMEMSGRTLRMAYVYHVVDLAKWFSDIVEHNLCHRPVPNYKAISFIAYFVCSTQAAFMERISLRQDASDPISEDGHGTFGFQHHEVLVRTLRELLLNRDLVEDDENYMFHKKRPIRDTLSKVWLKLTGRKPKVHPSLIS